ncbi:hypothetical protein KCU65_g428, partial [Aureobasidium melanogenum]
MSIFTRGIVVYLMLAGDGKEVLQFRTGIAESELGLSPIIRSIRTMMVDDVDGLRVSSSRVRGMRYRGAVSEVIGGTQCGLAIRALGHEGRPCCLLSGVVLGQCDSYYMLAILLLSAMPLL